MKFLKNIIHRVFVKENPVVHLGRWNVVYCTKTLDRKIDLSNEDHCGPCGQYIKIDSPKNNSIVKFVPKPLMIKIHNYKFVK